MRHFAISAANFCISNLVLQKQHRFKHKRRFSQVYKHKNEIKTILAAPCIVNKVFSLRGLGRVVSCVCDSVCVFLCVCLSVCLCVLCVCKLSVQQLVDMHALRRSRSLGYKCCAGMVLQIYMAG